MSTQLNSTHTSSPYTNWMDVVTGSVSSLSISFAKAMIACESTSRQAHVRNLFVISNHRRLRLADMVRPALENNNLATGADVAGTLRYFRATTASLGKERKGLTVLFPPT
jgi:hypothetical protein